MSLTLAAVGAVLAALLELTIVPYLRVGGAQPDLLLVFAVIWTMVVSFEGGLAWAFVGGLTTDLLGSSPIGVTSFSLLLSVGAAGLIGRFVTRARYVVPIAVVFLSSIATSLLAHVLYAALRGPVPVPDPFGLAVPGALYDMVIAAVLGPLAVGFHARYGEPERIDW
ncbi:MAG TPA: rod shape-determining protein MreD [Candidatus Limnocylindrales bacterium]